MRTGECSGRHQRDSRRLPGTHSPARKLPRAALRRVEITLNVRMDAEGEATLRTQIGVGGSLTYATAFGEERQVMNRAARPRGAFHGAGKRRVCVVHLRAWTEKSAVLRLWTATPTGLMEPNESARFIQVSTVTLLAKSGEAVAACRTGTDGRYGLLVPLQRGTRRIQFNAGESVIFSSGALYFRACFRARCAIRATA